MSITCYHYIWKDYKLIFLNHDIFQFWRHLVLANNVFKKTDFVKLGCREAAKIHEKSKIFTFLLFLDIFHPFEWNLTATEFFNFVIFTNFGVPDPKTWKNHDSGHVREPSPTGRGSLFSYHNMLWVPIGFKTRKQGFQYVERERCYGYRVTEMRRVPRACLALCVKSGSFEDFEHFISP